MTSATRLVQGGALVLVTGGLSFARAGSEGTGIALAAAPGHTIVRLYDSPIPIEPA